MRRSTDVVGTASTGRGVPRVPGGTCTLRGARTTMPPGTPALSLPLVGTGLGPSLWSGPSPVPPAGRDQAGSLPLVGT